ncbi:sugar ABC transporter substrate-binding protein [Labrys miyagiensis]
MTMLRALLSKLGRSSVAAISTALVLAGIGAAPAAAQDKPRIVMLAGPQWDPFFGAMKKGADDAARDLGVNYQWITGTDPNNFLADYAKLVKQAATQKPAAMVIGNYFPDTLDPIIKQITASGIPVIIQHDGGASWQDVGAISYVGFSARDLGRAVGEREVAAGAKFGLCVDHVPGNTTLDLDCQGYNDAFKAAGGNSKVLMIQFSDASNPTFVTNAIKGALQGDKRIDAIWTIGAVQGVASVEAVKQSGRKIVNGSLGLSLGSLEALKNGDLLFIADLQPYLDGYYALLAAYQYVQYKMLPMGQISTGPLMLTKDNVDDVLKVNQQFPGVRGAS